MAIGPGNVPLQVNRHSLRSESVLLENRKEHLHVVAYEQLSEAQWNSKIKAAYELASPCRLCPRSCGARRDQGEVGVCRAGIEARVASAGPHFGEEPPLVGRGGSGTIFLAHCNLGCVFCQNFDISQGHVRGHAEGWELGQLANPAEIAGVMLAFQKMGCHNINFVTPTHFVPPLLEALRLAGKRGLSLPIVFNCGGYESLEVLRILEGTVDIYMPDFKFGKNSAGLLYCQVPDYVEVCCEAVKEMQVQVGDLIMDESGVATRGLLIRHLVLPDDSAGSQEVFRHVRRIGSKRTFINVMDQYRPCHRANEFPEISRRLTALEYRQALEWAKDEGLTRVFH